MKLSCSFDCALVNLFCISIFVPDMTVYVAAIDLPIPLSITILYLTSTLNNILTSLCVIIWFSCISDFSNQIEIYFFYKDRSLAYFIVWLFANADDTCCNIFFVASTNADNIVVLLGILFRPNIVKFSISYSIT